MSVRSIIDCMRRQIELHEQLIEAGKDKRQAIMVNDVERLTAVITRENRLLKQVAETEALRQGAADNFLREKGIRSQLQLTVTELTRLVFNPEEKDELLAVQRELTDRLLELKELNNSNRDLIEQSLDFIDYSLNLLVSNPDDDMLYRHPNQPNTTGKGHSMFDTRA
ncbi:MULTISPECIES: flagellar protein FlgN [Paenibacillus]|uniref:Flagellar biosynthesis protein FlgN n=1 Tax=Paenibacillus campinasensis TaxID=66347 RepID=A0A268EKL2_9BACL|nr:MULTISPECIES: flagellar protein FlgN [Paenibacillus]MUG68084.1 flagellar protein FlgN [Paenibacillus campinasensis]PAD73649.1 flagellar biosynthesis protein FlgN [Paenibacillus campinasensis]PAK51971.1 flagellar biosynthesis protein FlgN [Paenibacillus sp. 7541]